MQLDLYNDVGTTDQFFFDLKIEVPCVFSTTLDASVELVVGTAKSWILPPLDCAPVYPKASDPIVVTIPAELQPYITFTG